MANQSIPTNVRAAIAAVNENIITAFKKGDAAGIAACYTENGQWKLHRDIFNSSNPVPG